LVTTLSPSYVIHLAAVSFVGHDDIDTVYRTNIVGTRNLLSAVSALPHVKSVLLASSANIYGNNPTPAPITEDIRPQPANDYAVSKAAMEQMAALWQDRVPLSIVRPFNYTGRGQSARFLVPKIVNAFATKANSLELGNLDVARDFCDVRDVVRAYRALLETDTRGTFNICSGRAYSLRELIALAAEISGHELEVRVNQAFVRASEVKRLLGSADRLRSTIPSWSPREMRSTLTWMLGSTEAG
jgi:nucleoside-diphosphate-sugar epimerase